jgi:hypothetical protein
MRLGSANWGGRYDMKRSMVLAVLFIGLAFAGSLGIPAPASAEYCRPAMPDHARDARGYTFRASITGIRVEGDSPGETYVTMAVKKVYANRDSERLRAGMSIDVYSNRCDGFGLLGLEVDDEVLISTKYLEAGDGPSTWNTALWQIEGDSLRLAILKSGEFGRIWFTADRRIAKADTLREALALVAPEAVGMPDTATAGARNSEVASWPMLLVSASAFVLAALALRARDRREPRSRHDRKLG